MDALRRTVRPRRVGDSVKGGLQRRHRPDYQIILYMGLLMLLGLIVIYAIGPLRANVLNNTMGSEFSDTYFALKQGISLAVALAAFIFMAVVPFTLIKKYTTTILLAGLAACVVLALFGALGVEQIAQCTNGACRWFNMGPLGSLQPAEILKFGMLLFVALFLGRRIQAGEVNDVHKTLLPLGVLTAVAMLFIVLIQKDMGTGISLMAILATIIVIAGIKVRTGLIALGLVLLAGVLMILVAPHRLDRVTTFFNGDATSTSNASTYHIEHAKIAIGSGGLTGVGIGNSVQATGYLPESINDSVFAIMGETFGFVGLVVILALFTGLLMRLLKIIDHLADPQMKLVVAGVFGWLGAHVVLNVAAMIGVVPLTGITLPLLSFGGTSMLFMAGALGLSFQLSRYTQHRSHMETEGKSHETARRGRGLGRTRYASSRGY